MHKRLIFKVIQNLLLFAIAGLLVTGFYYHAEFYKLGWISLLIIGSIITFIILKAIIWLNYDKFTYTNFNGVLIFRSEEANQVKHGMIKQIIRPNRKSNIKPGEIYKAKLNVMSDQHFSELLIKEVSSKKLSELSDKDIFLTGASSRDEFKKDWMAKYNNWYRSLIVKIIRFEPLNAI